mmetsp:Transcript_54420/g.74391  ORF Transcript_54420/g.74391 Transcript_54420/m.74391 type:complete len:106 (-) Transcript_54420:99-416(-)
MGLATRRKKRAVVGGGSCGDDDCGSGGSGGDDDSDFRRMVDKALSPVRVILREQQVLFRFSSDEAEKRRWMSSWGRNVWELLQKSPGPLDRASTEQIKLIVSAAR